MNASAGLPRNGAGSLKLLLCTLPAALLLAGCDFGLSQETPVVVAASCSIDRPAPDFQATAGTAFNVMGWAFDKNATQAPAKTQVQFTSPDMKVIKVVDASQGIARPDVAQALNAPGAANAGYDAAVAGDLLPAGTYAVTILQRYATYSVACSYARNLTVK